MMVLVVALRYLLRSDNVDDNNGDFVVFYYSSSQ